MKRKQATLTKYESNELIKCTMTMTYKPAVWVLLATRCHVKAIICAKLFSNPSDRVKVMVRSRKLTC